MLETTLSAMGIKTGKDLRERAADLIICFKESTYGFLIRRGLAISNTEHETDPDGECQKGISVDHTFKQISKIDQFKQKISEIAQELERRM
jgi:nucleotidyltransferase/DNA polymerase involved in DNA repair